jgi:hypothetical protein
MDWPLNMELAQVISSLEHDALQLPLAPEPAALRSSRALNEAAYRLFLAGLLFLQQRIVTDRPTQAPRATRRRYERERGSNAMADPPLIRIVMLRAVEARGATGQRQVERQYHWLVRGHWRNQYYPKAMLHRPRWIAPHIRGDTTKPLKMPTRPIFAVTR